MVARVKTVAFIGMRPLEITVEAQVSPGLAAFNIVGLPDKAVGEAKERIRSTFFHLGLFFQKAVGMHVVEGGQSRKIIYEQAYFDMPANSPARDLPAGAGFAGMRIQDLPAMMSSFPSLSKSDQMEVSPYRRSGSSTPACFDTSVNVPSPLLWNSRFCP